MRIAVGQEWETEIQEAITSATAALLLVSADYLASALISESESPQSLERAQKAPPAPASWRPSRELPLLLERSRKGELQLFWVALSACDWEHSPLANVQSVRDPNKPLNAIAPKNLNRELALMAEGIARLIAPTVPPGETHSPAGA